MHAWSSQYADRMKYIHILTAFHNLVHHPQYHPTHLLQPEPAFRRK